MSTVRPNDFPLKSTITGDEELYTQTGGTNNKFTVNQIIALLGTQTITPLEFTFTNVSTYTDTHNLGRQPIAVRVVEVNGATEQEIDVIVETDVNSFTIKANDLISGKVYIL